MYSTSYRIMLVYGIAFIFVCLFFVPFTTHAQATPTVAQFTLSPEYPTPQSEVAVSLNAYAQETAGASIVWTIDGEQRRELDNNRSITVSIGELGSVRRVFATVVGINGTSFTIKRDIVPTEVHLIIEADTYVPAFYRGRPLPGPLSTYRAIAIAQNGTALDPNNLTYTWEANNAILFGGPMVGKQSVDVSVPRFSGGYVKVTVDQRVNTRSGSGLTRIGEAAFRIDAVSPELHFYEENLLRGLREIAVTKPIALVGEETTVYAEPYYLAKNIDSNTLDFAWSVNNEPTVNESFDQHAITLRKTGGSGNAWVSVRALKKDSLTDYVKGDFGINF